VFDAAAFAQTIEAIKAAPWVTKLRFMSMRTLDGVQIARIITATRRVTHVYVCGCDLTDDDVVAVCAALAGAGVGGVELQLVWFVSPKLGVASAIAIAELLRSGCDVKLVALVHCWGDEHTVAVDVAAAHIAAALAENRTVEYFRFDELVSDAVRQSFRDAMHCNLVVKKLPALRHWGTVAWHATANASVAQIVDARTPLLRDGLRTSSGDFDALPNEMPCAIAERMWPTEAALTAFVHVCARFRDCMLSDYVVKHRHGRRPDNGQWTSGDQRFFYRRIALDCMAL
jgi:hypothetical protein